MTAIATQPFSLREAPPKLHLGKAILTAFVIAGLATATIFSGSAIVGMLGAGAASWVVGLTVVGFLGSAITFCGAGYFASKHHMFENTEQNGEDAKQFLIDTFGTGIQVAALGIDCVRDWEIWSLITAQK